MREKEILQGYFVRDDGTLRTKTGKITTGSLTRAGYHQVTMYSNRKMYTKMIHRLVAQAFLLKSSIFLGFCENKKTHLVVKSKKNMQFHRFSTQNPKKISKNRRLRRRNPKINPKKIRRLRRRKSKNKSKKKSAPSAPKSIFFWI